MTFKTQAARTAVLALGLSAPAELLGAPRPTPQDEQADIEIVIDGSTRP